MPILDWTQVQTHILEFEREGLVTRTFRRLDPERQQAVVHAILEEASEKGPTSLNIKQVAERAGVSVGSLYQYFGNREGLLNFAISLSVRYMIDLFEQFRPMLVGLPLRDALRYYLLGGIEWGGTEAGLVRFFGRAAYEGDPSLAEHAVRPVARVMRALVRDILTQAAARGEVRADIDLEATTRVVNALMIAIGDAELFPHLNVYFQVSDEDVPLERVIDALIEMVLTGIANRPGQPR
jgi:TetR/AcrR family transcriptional regulator